MSAIIRPLTEGDLPTARRILRTAFGTFLGAPDLENFWADRDLVYGRFGAEHVASFAAEVDGELVGSNFATNWGSVGFLGADHRSSGSLSEIGRALLAKAMTQFDAWGTRHRGRAFSILSRGPAGKSCPSPAQPNRSEVLGKPPTL